MGPPAFAQNGGPAAESFDAPDADWLFVQSADAVTFDGKTLTLQNVAPRTIMFADRPNRMAGNISTGRLVDDWAAGTNSFQADPPNASLSARVGDDEQVSVVELTNPRLRGTSLSYDVRVLEGMVPPNSGAATLFIDAWPAPLGGRCHRDQWATSSASGVRVRSAIRSTASIADQTHAATAHAGSPSIQPACAVRSWTRTVRTRWTAWLQPRSASVWSNRRLVASRRPARRKL